VVSALAKLRGRRSCLFSDPKPSLKTVDDADGEPPELERRVSERRDHGRRVETRRRPRYDPDVRVFTYERAGVLQRPAHARIVHRDTGRVGGQGHGEPRLPEVTRGMQGAGPQVTVRVVSADSRMRSSRRRRHAVEPIARPSGDS
jgi:hypothetical protein